MNLKDQMLAVDPSIEKADVAGWPEDLYIRQIKAAEMDQYRGVLHEDENSSWVLQAVYWIALVSCTKEGENIFVRGAENNIPQKDIDRLMDMPLHIVRSLSERILGHNKLLEKSLEETVKNSEETPKQDGGTK